ncbi:hypothetical protein B0H14DRAFT_2944284, partial [Mycena olivaceomarginata]
KHDWTGLGALATVSLVPRAAACIHNPQYGHPMPTPARSAHLPRHLLDIHAIHPSRFTAIVFTALATFPWAPGQRSRRVSLLGGAGRAHFAWLLLIEVEGCRRRLPRRLIGDSRARSSRLHCTL